MTAAALTLVCFAMKEEAKPFLERSRGKAGIKAIVTGIGQLNSERSIKKSLETEKPNLVLTCGFAGGLRVGLKLGDVLFSAEKDSALETKLNAAGAAPGNFHCARRIAVTSAQKRALRDETRADAVEMESGFVCAICAQRGIPVATVRVILDTVEEDLPLDFNQLAKQDQEMDYWKLTKALIKSPGKVGSLLRLQKISHQAACRLADVLVQVI